MERCEQHVRGNGKDIAYATTDGPGTLRVRLHCARDLVDRTVNSDASLDH